MAIEFFNCAASFSNTICFILPNQFAKWTVHKQLNTQFNLIYEWKLPKNSFFTETKNDYDVNSIFQIWTCLKHKYNNKRIVARPHTTHRDFVMYQYNNTKEALKVFDNEFDFAFLVKDMVIIKKL